MDEILLPTEQFRQALATFDENFQKFLTFVNTYPASHCLRAGACGVWSAKQVMEHLSAWILYAFHQYDRFDLGELHTWEYGDVDDFNAAAVAFRATQTWEQSLEELHEMVDKLHVRALRVIPEQINECEGYAQWLQTLGEDAAAHQVELVEFMEQPA